MPDLSYSKLSDGDVANALASLHGWAVSEGKLAKSFSFPDYKSALVFSVAVGHEAERLNHHPDMLVTYGRVLVTTVTHDSGGLTSYDVELARRVDALA